MSDIPGQMSFGDAEDEEPPAAPPSRPDRPIDRRRVTDAAIDRADKAADEEWKARAVRTLHHICLTNERFTPDHLWLAGLDRPREPRALGGIMRRGRANGWMELTGEVTECVFKTQHKNVVNVWRSLIYQGA